MFDRDIEIDSIYYTDDEIAKLQNSDGFEGFLPAYTFTTSQGPQTRYYGYNKKTGDKTEIIFKNISIIHNKNYGNLLEYFDAPRFEDSRRLIIPPKKTNLAPSGTAFQVSLNRDFFYTYEDKEKEYKKDIGMRSVHKWIFWVNGNTDTVNPSFGQLNILNNEGDIIPTSYDTQNRVYLNKNKAILLRVSTVDEGSGPSDNLDLKLYEKDAADDADPLKTVYLKYENNEGSYATFGNAIEGNIDEGKKKYYKCALNSLPDESKEYKFILTAYDKNGNHVDSAPYYVSMDVTPPELCKDPDNPTTYNYFKGEAAANTDARINCKFLTTADDLDKVTILYRKAIATDNPDWEDWTEATPVANVTITDLITYRQIDPIISNLEHNSTYELKVELKDKAKNSITYYFLKNTKPDINVDALSASYDEFSRVFKITSSEDVSFCNTLMVKPASSGNSGTTKTFTNIGNNTFIYNPDNAADGSLFAAMGTNYSIGLQFYTNTEVINNTKYTNNTCSYTNTRNISSKTLLLSTKPQGIKGFKSYPVVTANSVQFECTVKSYDSLDIWYAMYDDDGNLGEWTGHLLYTSTDGKPTITGLTENKRYRFKFITKKYGLSCDDSQIVETEVTIKAPAATVVKPNPVRNLAVANGYPTKTTVKLTWTSPQSNQNGIFKGIYIIKWIENRDGYNLAQGEGKTSDWSEREFTVTGLKPDTSYKFTVQAYENGALSDEETVTLDTTENLPSIENMYVCKNGSKFQLKYTVSSLNSQEWTFTLGRANSYTASYFTTVSDVSLESTGGYKTVNLPDSMVKSNNDFVNKKIYLRITAANGSRLVYSEIIVFNPKIFGTFGQLHITPSNDSITFETEGNNSIKRYRYRLCSSSGDWIEKVKTGKEITIDGLTSNTAYDFEFSTNSSLLGNNFVIEGVACAVTLNPVVQTFSAYPGSDSVRLTWKDGNSTYYNVYKKSGSNKTLIADKVTRTQGSSFDSECTVVNLSPETEYTFVVAAINQNGQETFCEPITTTTTAKPAESVYPVTEVQCNSTYDGYNLSWFGNGASYLISYKKSTDPGTDAYWTTPESTDDKPNPTTEKEYKLTGLTAGTQYDVKIVAIGSDGTEAAPTIESFYTYSNCGSFETKDRFEVTKNSIKAKWRNPSRNNYFVMKVVCWPKGDTTQEVVLATIYPDDAVKPTSFLLEDLHLGAIVCFEIRAYSDPTLQVCSKSEQRTIELGNSN